MLKPNVRHPFLVVVITAALVTVPVVAQKTDSLPARSGAEPKKMTLNDLPMLGQYAISGALGKEQAAFHVRTEGSRHHMTNPRHGLVADLGPKGVEIRSGETKVRLSLKAFGFEGAVRPPATGQPNIRDNRIEFHRGGLTEWYVNGPLGIQQGFTVARAPKEGDEKTLSLVLHLFGDLEAEFDTDGTGLTLRDGRDGQGSALRYAGLLAYDADKRPLQARLEARDDQVRIRVDTQGARYPIVIDPVFQSAKLLASDGAGYDRFGDAVSVSGTRWWSAPGASPPPR